MATTENQTVEELASKIVAENVGDSAESSPNRELAQSQNMLQSDGGASHSGVDGGRLESDYDRGKSAQPPDGQHAIELQRRLLAKTKTDKSNPIANKHIYDTVGTNGIFFASPSVVKFAGFETNKTHTMKLRLINNSPQPQRLHILPPQTSYFKIRYNKKGMVPTGVAEEIYIQFTPAMDEYKYYYDSVRIHCDGDKILIPIHAFPVINSKQDELFPKYIDMGKGCRLGQSYQKQLQIESNCPVNFEYQIEVTKPHPEIHVSPLAGDILGLQTTAVDFAYNPKSYATAECEIMIRTTQFDSEPKLIRVVGSAAPGAELAKMTDSMYDRMAEDQSRGLGTIYEEDQANKPKTLLQSRPVRPGSGVRLQKIPGRSQQASTAQLRSVASKAGGAELGSGMQTSQGASVVLNLKSVKLSPEEQEFTRAYRALEELEREKGIKFFQCVGDPPHTEGFVESLQNRRQYALDSQADEMRAKDCGRFATQIDSDKVLVATTALADLAAKPKWDAFENNHFAMRRRLVSIFLRNANKLICRLRAGKRLAAIKSWIHSHGIRSREEMKRMVAEDYKKAQNTRLVDDTDAADDIRNVKFEFNFATETIKQGILKLPLEYETNIASFLEKVEANPPTNFDDLEPYEPLEELDFEIQAYLPQPTIQMSQYDPAERDRPNRPGCEHESILRRRAGEPDLEKVQIAAHEQQAMLKKNTKDIVSGAIVKMPASFLKPLDYSVELVIRADQHPTLREYHRLPGTSSTEVDAEFNLYPSVRMRQQENDEIMLRRQSVAKAIEGNPPVVSTSYMLGMSKTVSGSYVNNLDLPTTLLPGNFGVRVIDQMMPTSLSDVYRDRRSMQLQSFTCENRIWEIPELMPAPQEVDYLTDDESDEGTFELKVPELDALITDFETGDDKLATEEAKFKEHLTDLKARGFVKEIREEIKQTKIEKTLLLDSNITSQRAFFAATLPGMLEDLNQATVDTQNRNYLR